MNAEDLAAAVRTVVQVADYLSELKLAADELAARIDVRRRGYFSSREDEETRALLISYWQSRCALFDLITSFRQDDDLSEQERPQAFLTAFAAALVLVDAARFLRAIADQRPVVRRKFNEPAPQFGVPGGVYDTIQRSLLSARHGWHLFHAIRYFEQHEGELRGIAANSGLQPVLVIIDRLKHRLDVPVTQFARARLRTRTDQILRGVARGLFGQAMYGLQKLAGTLAADKFVRPGHRPALPPDIARQVGSLLAPGDVLVARKEYALTNYFLPGYWPHAALYFGAAESLERLGIRDHEHVQPRWAQLLETGNQQPCRVLEAMKDGVQIRSLDSPFAADSLVVLRPKLTRDDIGHALARSLKHEGKPYDFSFDFRRADRLVCTEVIYRAYDGIGSIELPLIPRVGRLTLSGGDLIRMAVAGRNFEPAAVYAPAFSTAVITGPETVDVIRQAQSESNDELGDP